MSSSHPNRAESGEERARRVEAAIGIKFRDISLLVLALKHASASESRMDSNERLEFLGDAILGATVCGRIFELFPDLLEGEMTKIKSTVVSRRTCAKIASKLGLDQAMELGKGMMMQDSLPSSLAAGVVESVIGAVYLDQGFETAHKLIASWCDPYIESAEQSGHQQNFKSLLQQHAQAAFSQTPAYRVLDEKGPDHAKAFKIAVELRGEMHTACWGQSKKQAEQQAALTALRELGVIEAGDGGEAKLAATSSHTTG